MFEKLIRLVPSGSATPRKITLAAILAAVFVTLLLFTEILVTAAATVWALAGLLHLHFAAIVVLSVIAGVPALWAGIAAGVMAFGAETDPANN